MSDKKSNPCSFLSEKGCSVYESRPYSCRAYPFEPTMQEEKGDECTITSFVVRHGDGRFRHHDHNRSYDHRHRVRNY